jgi:hypothetical protein
MHIDYQTNLELRDKYAAFNVREFKLTPQKIEYEQEFNESENFTSIDGLVMSELSKVESEVFDTNVLMQMYDNLEILKTKGQD